MRTDLSLAVLRICPGASAGVWWHAARRRRDAPRAIAALLAGRHRVELTAHEATAALTWAGTVDGWAAADPKPLFIHQPEAAQS